MLLLPTMTFGKASPRARVSRPVFSLSWALAGPLLTLVLGLLGSASGCGGSEDARPKTWSFVSTAILEPSCATANCHSAIAVRAGVDLSTRAAGYASLIGDDAVPRFYVISQRVGDSLTPPLTAEQRLERSSVPKLMRAVGNLRMPPDLPLPEPDIVLFENWILAGAKND
jgi:hypothetical protein